MLSLLSIVLLLVAAPVVLVLLFAAKMYISATMQYKRFKNVAANVEESKKKPMPQGNFLQGIYNRFVKKMGPMETVVANAQKVCN